ncbi:XdhC family protein [soil metagenome]
MRRSGTIRPMSTMTMHERAAQLRLARTPFVHATVVRAQQPTSAHAGDEAIMLSDGTIEGFVGGQCAQNSVRKAALGALQTNQSVLLRVLPDGDVAFPEAPGACVVVNPCLSGGALEIFLVPQVPAPLMRIHGSTPIADALVEMCGVLGYDVLGGDSTDGLAGATAVVIASHGGAEAEMIRAALNAGVGYIGLVASRIRGMSVLDGLVLTESERERVHTPVGLAIGAKTPAEIAVSIVAEVIAAIRVDGLAVPVRDAQAPERAIDPVCGMTVVMVPGAEHLRVGDDDYWFCGPGCRTSFAAAQAGT